MKIYLVGGAVRDFLLNLPVKDRDWVVVGSTPKELKKNKFKQVGKDFPVFLHPKTFEEYALARTEKKSGFGYTGFSTNYSKNVTLYEDLLRRDLTINAIAQDKNGNFIDPLNGRKDIKLRLLRHVSKAFKEDPLRILRTARFAAQFSHLGFRIEKKTMIFMKSITKTGEVSFLTSHRIWNETKKALITSSPHVYFYVLKKCNALSVIFPEIYHLYNIKLNYGNCYNNLGDYFLYSLSNFSKSNFKLDIRFSFICQFFIYYKNIFNFIKKKNNCSNFQINLVKNMLKRLNVPIYIQNLSLIVSENYFLLHNIFFLNSKAIVILFDRMNVWRNPNKVIKIGVLSEYCIFFNECNCFLKKYKIRNFYKIIFFILSAVSVKFIIKEGFKGFYIKKELIKLRTLFLDIYRLKVFLITKN